MTNEYSSELEITIRRDSATPIYRQIAAAFEQAISEGRLAPGRRLPTHRLLANQLEINITTVTQAYALLKEKELVSSKAGRGTIVRGYTDSPEHEPSAPHPLSGDVIDLTVNRPSTDTYRRYLKQLLPVLSGDERFSSLADYQDSAGPMWARKAGASWVSRFGPTVASEQVLVCAGAQHGLSAALTALCRSGDVIATDEVTYQGINGLASTHGLRVRGITQDDSGMSPEVLDQACREQRVRAVFFVPALHNPTTRTLTDERRHALAAVAAHHDLIIIEDDVYAPLLNDRPASFAELEPERTIYVTSLSKSVAPGLRVGFLAAPSNTIADLNAALRIDYWSGDPLNALIATKMIETGHAWTLISDQRDELRQRVELARRFLGAHDLTVGANSNHAWLTLPKPWRGAPFADECLTNGVRVLGAEIFTVGRAIAPHAIRINLSAARSQHELARGLEIIGATLGKKPLRAPFAI